MKRVLGVIAALAILAALPSHPSAQAANGSARDRLVVSPAWLAAHLCP